MRLRPLGEQSKASWGERGGHLDSATAPAMIERYAGLLRWAHWPKIWMIVQAQLVRVATEAMNSSIKKRRR